MLCKLYKDGENLEICWIPAHVGIKGNEADKAAITMSGSHMAIPVSDL